jgi:hypothetical protein
MYQPIASDVSAPEEVENADGLGVCRKMDQDMLHS